MHDWSGDLVRTAAAVAKQMQVSAKSFEDICQRKAPVTTDMAGHLSRAVGSRLRLWTQLQADYDATQAELTLDQFNVKRIERAA